MRPQGTAAINLVLRSQYVNVTSIWFKFFFTYVALDMRSAYNQKAPEEETRAHSTHIHTHQDYSNQQKHGTDATSPFKLLLPA